MPHHFSFSPCGGRLLSGPLSSPASGGETFFFWAPGSQGEWAPLSASPSLPAGAQVLDVAWAPSEHGSVVGAVAAVGGAYSLLVYREVGGAWVLQASLDLLSADPAGGAAAAPSGCLCFAPYHLGLRLACSVGAAGLVRVYACSDPAQPSAWELSEEFLAAPPGLAAGSPVTCLRWCPSSADAPLLAVACGGQAHLWGLAWGAPAGVWVAMLELCGASSAPAAGSTVAQRGLVLAWAPSPGRSEHCIATGSAQGRLVFWRVAAASSASGRALAAGGEPGATPGLRARAAASGGLVGGVATSLEEDAGLQALQWNRAGTALASFSTDGSMRLWRQELSGQWACSYVEERQEGMGEGGDS